MKIERIIEKARRRNRIQDGLVLCNECDTPASFAFSTALGWPVCAPCATGEADSFDDSDLIAAMTKSERKALASQLTEALRPMVEGNK